MKGYRYPSYECKVTNQDDVVEEIVFQKRVELWEKDKVSLILND